RQPHAFAQGLDPPADRYRVDRRMLSGCCGGDCHRCTVSQTYVRDYVVQRVCVVGRISISLMLTCGGWVTAKVIARAMSSEARRVGKECRSRWSPCPY